jgi:CubicO group peptidase (beta-lactamase class C family)
MDKKRLARLVAQAITAVAVLLALRGSASADYVARHGLTPAEYQSTFTTLTGQGYRLRTVSGYVDGGGERYAALFERASGPAWVARNGLSPADYQTAFDTLGRQGYRLIWVSAHEVGGQLHYEGIWEQRGGPPLEARHGMSAAQYQQTFNDLTHQGYRLLHVSGYTSGGNATYAAIFEKSAGPVWVARNGLTAAQYQAAFDGYTRQGYRLKEVSGYHVGSDDQYAAIWEQTSGPVTMARNGIPTTWYQNVFDNYHYQGYEPVFITAFTSGNGARVNGIWDNSNYSGADLGVVQSQMAAYMTANNVPGAAVAITKDGRLVYAAGFGYANTEQGVEAAPTNMWRIASVSKNITTTGIMKLVEAGRLHLTDKVFGPGGILAAEFPTPPSNTRINEITVQHLLWHVSGLSNSGGDPMFMNLQMDHAQLISWMLNDPAHRDMRNPMTRFEYLNFGYCLLGRIIERVTGQSYEQWIRANVLAPAGVTEMAIGRNSQSAPLPREVTYYPESAAYSLNVTRFDSHGGWVASPIDLVRYVVRVDGLATKPDIISAQSHTTMLIDSHVPDSNGNDPNYGFGWGLPQWHNGAIDGSIAFLKVMPGGYTYAVICNSRPANDSDAFTLSGVVENIIGHVSHWPAYDLF